MLGEEDDEEIELGPRARAALTEPKAHDMFEEENPAEDMLAHFAAKRQGRLVVADNIVLLEREATQASGLQGLTGSSGT